MVGYIYVTDAPHFGTTEADGTLKLKGLAPGRYKVTFWNPLIADAPERQEAAGGGGHSHGGGGGMGMDDDDMDF